MPEENQQFIFNTEELSLLKNTFAENSPLLYAVRKVFLQFELTDGDKVSLKQAITPEVFACLKKRILPDLSPEYPLGQIPSLLTTLTDQIKVKDENEMSAQFEAKELEQAYLQQCFETLQGVVDDKGVDQTIKLVELGTLAGKDSRQKYIDITAYLFILGYVDPMLGMVKAIAGEKEETPEEQTKRLTRNSNK